MQRQGNELDFTGQQVYVGIDVGKKSWDVSIMTTEFEHKTYKQPPDPGVLARYLRRNFPGAEYKSVYEAGFSGYGAHEELKANGIDSMVVNPGDVPTTASEKARKTNKIDARKLARSLRSGELHGIYVPSREAQEDRSLVRMRQTLVRKQTRVKNQIKSFLVFYGVKLPDDIGEKYWSKRFINWIEGLASEERSGSYSLRILIEELKNLRKMILEVTGKIKALSEESRYREDVIDIVSIPGFSTISAMMMTEIIDISRFKKLDDFRSYFGIVPGEHSTGEEETTTGLTRIRDSNNRGGLGSSAKGSGAHDGICQAKQENEEERGDNQDRQEDG